MATATNWRWRNLDPLLDEWGHEPQILEALADIADTPTNRLPGSTVWADSNGTPLAILRYVQAGTYQIMFKIALGYDFNGLAIVYVTRP